MPPGIQGQIAQASGKLDVKPIGAPSGISGGNPNISILA
jgi:hypothetical protein